MELQPVPPTLPTDPRYLRFVPIKTRSGDWTVQLSEFVAGAGGDWFFIAGATSQPGRRQPGRRLAGKRHRPQPDHQLD